MAAPPDRPPIRRGLPAAGRYALAVGAVGAAALFTALDPSSRARTPFLLAAAAVMLASWVGGLGPGLAATALAAALLAWFVLPPFGGLGLGEGMLEGLVLFLFVALLTVVLNETRRRGGAERERLLERERAARAAAEASEARFRRLFEGAADAVVIVGPDGRVAEANPAASALLGYAPDEFRGLALGHGQVAALTPERAAVEWDALRKKGAWRGELELRRKDGSTVPVEAAASVVALPDGEAWFVTWRDASERRASAEAQGELLAGLAHDLKNPLTTVRGRVQLLQRQTGRGNGGDLAKLADGLAEVGRAVDRMAALLDELADLARLRLGQPLELRRAPTDLVALVRAAAAAHAGTSARHAVRVDAPAPSLVGNWDEPRLERVLDNLVGNAVKYSPAGGEIAVRVRARGGRAVLEVEDRGIGIPAADLPHVFERFRRAGNAGGTAEGTGVGLATARQIVEQHGGAIGIESAEGEGTTVTVELPLARGE